MARLFTRTIAAVVSVAGLALASVTASAQTNNLTDLGAVAPGLGINASGQVVLEHDLYNSGTLTPLPADLVGEGINAGGQVVGSVGAPSANCGSVGSLDQAQGCAIGVYASGTLTTYPIYMGSLDPAVGNQGLSINASGQVAGDWVFLHGQGGAVVLTNSVFTALSTPNCGGGLATPAGVAYGINDAGQVAALLPYDPSGIGQSCAGYAFFVSQGVYYPIGVGAALALNASGQVVGYLQVGIPTSSVTVVHAFLYSLSGTGTAMDLGTLPGDLDSYAYAINASALVVGTSLSTQANRAFFYDGVMSDLNSLVGAGDPLQPFVKLTDARGINDSGLIIVNGVDSRDQANHAYLLQVPLLQVAPGPLTFSSQAIGTTSAPQTVTFTNVGATSIVLGGASISSQFKIQTNNCGASLASTAACTVTVAYTPTVAGNPTGGLTLVSGGVPIIVPLSSSSPLSDSIKASATTVMTGSPVTLTWAFAAGATCLATGGSAADGWTGTLAASGNKAVTESAAGTYTYGITCTAGSQTQSAQVAVAVTWPVVTASISASPTTVNASQPTTLTWKSANATSCVGAGGGANDGWASNGRPVNGSVPVTEPNPPTAGASETLSFTITCTSSVSKLSSSASVKVVQLGPSSSKSGGGAFDTLSLAFLFGVFALLRRRAAT